MVKDDFPISKMIQMSICSGLRGWPGALVAFQASHGIVLEPSNSGPTTVNNTLTVVASIPFFHFTSLLKMHPILRLELGTRGPKHPTAMPGGVLMGRGFRVFFAVKGGL